MAVEYASNYPLYPKQVEALRVIANEANGNAPQSLDAIISNMTYTVTKQSFQFTLRSLIKRGLVEKVGRQTSYGKSRRMIKITELGRHKLALEDTRFVTSKPADPKTCEMDEVEKTDKLMKQIEDEYWKENAPAWAR